MKQRIEAKQIGELSDEARRKLSDWWKPTCGDFYTDNLTDYNDFWREAMVDYYPEEKDAQSFKNEFIPVLSIGQMIEFLIDSKSVPIISHFIQNYDSSPHGVPTFLDDGYLMEVNPENWCDALWEACKEVLNERN